MKTTAARVGAFFLLLLAPAIASPQSVDDEMLRELLASHGQTPLQSPPFVVDEK